MLMPVIERSFGSLKMSRLGPAFNNKIRNIRVGMDENYISIPAADGCSSILTPWGREFAPMIERGVQCAQAWLDTTDEIPLWWELTQARKTFPQGDCQDAFEAGFLLRIQQRLRGVRQ